MPTVPDLLPCPQLVCTSGFYLLLENLSEEQEKELIKSLRVTNPKVAQQKRFTGWVTRDTPKLLTGYIRDPSGALSIAPGAGAMIWQYAQKWGVDLVFHGPARPEKMLTLSYLGEKRGLQDRIIQAANTRRQGVFVAPCGSGKTDIGLRLIADRGVPTLVIVHTRELRDQWVERAAERMGVKALALQAVPKKPITDKPLVVATVQWLVRHGDVLPTLNEHCKMVIVDECHHTPCSTFTQVLSRLDPYWRYGFTATPEREDGCTALMHWWIGPTLGEIGNLELEAAGLVMRPTLDVRISSHVQSEYDPMEPGDYHRVTQLLEGNLDRLAQISTDIASDYNERGGTHLVLVSHIPYLERLLAAVAPLLTRPGMVAAIIGPMGKIARRDVLRRVKSGEIRILFATTLADEGLDLPILTRGWLVSPTRSKGRIQQRIGRLCRMLRGKEKPVVTCYVDVGVRRTVTAEGRSVVKRLFVGQFKACLANYRKICDVNEEQVRAALNWREM